jgi:hypothetical protein
MAERAGGLLAAVVRRGFRYRFLGHLVRATDIRLVRRVDRRYAALVRDEIPELDERARMHRAFALLVLATYQELIARDPDRAAAFALTQRVFLAAAHSPPIVTLFIRMGVRPWAPGEAFARISANYVRRGRRLFGSGFAYREDRDTRDQLFVGIHRCLYYRTFSEAGAPELTRMFCTWDAAWADELSRPRYAVMFERPTLLSHGDDYCRFQFTQLLQIRSREPPPH